MNIEVNIFSFSHYKSFLQNYYQLKKINNPRFSLQAWSNKAGFQSKSTLSMILNGSRLPSKMVVDKFINYFEFKTHEAEYFKDLVRLEKIIDDPRLSILLMEKMAKIHPSGGFKLLDPASFELISSWKHYAIREMVLLDGFVEDPKWIVKRLAFKITIKEVVKAINNLLELGLLKYDNNKKLFQSDNKVSTTDGISSEALKRFHEENLKNAHKAVRLFDVDKRYMSGTVFTIKKENLSKAKKIIRRFEDNMLDLFEETQGNSTVLLNIQLFPLTKD